jgi:hypothetical protein
MQSASDTSSSESKAGKVRSASDSSSSDSSSPDPGKKKDPREGRSVHPPLSDSDSAAGKRRVEKRKDDQRRVGQKRKDSRRRQQAAPRPRKQLSRAQHQPIASQPKVLPSKLPKLSDAEDSDSTLEKDGPPKDKSSAERASDRRNLFRVEQANVHDETLLGKYLPADIDVIFPEILEGPDDSFEAPKWLFQAIQSVAKTKVRTPDAPPVRFDTTPEGLQFNSDLLRDFDYDLEKFMESQSSTTMGYGAEFRPLEQLNKIFHSHPVFPFFREILSFGMDYRFTSELTEEERIAELDANVKRGNHKSAEASPAKVTALLAKDVRHGFSLPVLPSLAYKLVGALVQPCGMVRQFALNALGSRELKERLTQDLSYSITAENISVNDRIDMSQYSDMIYGWCLGRTIHFIVALRLRFPNQRIFISKYDYSDAYRRVAHSARAAVQSIIIFAAIAYIALRLTFGGSANPPTWCAFSEMVTDLSNEIPLCPEWNPEDLHSPDQPTAPAPRAYPDSTPLAQARPMAVKIPTSVTARTDSFIDDLIRVFLDTPSSRVREPHAVPLAIFVTSRPHAGDSNEPIPRRSLMQAAKLIAEGTPAEVQTVLGWLLDTHRLQIQLPVDKFIAWTTDIATILESSRCTFGALESTTGRLNHVSFVIPLARHFLNRLRLRTLRRLPKTQQLTLSKEELNDLHLWLKFLNLARSGISLNRLTVRRPTQLGLSDSCPFGLGGFSLNGRAWRLQIPPSCAFYGDSTINNLLEFLAMMVTIWIILLECDELGLSEECILVLGDNTSAIGWLFRSGRIPKSSFYYEAVQLVARKLAELITDSSHILASQHLKGQKNVVADLLSYVGSSREEPSPIAPDNPSDAELTRRFHSLLPQLIPQSFAILPLPDEILSFATLALQTAELSWIRVKNLPTKAKTASGAAGLGSVMKHSSTLTPSSLLYLNGNESSSFDPSSRCTETLRGLKQADFLESVRRPWWHQLCALPQATWLRRSGVVSNKAPFTSRTEPSFGLPSALSSPPSTT